MKPLTNRQRAHLWFDRYYEFIPNDGICIYCGELADESDHFLPISKAGLYEGGYFIVESCRECNSIARDKVFQNIDDKMQFIHRELSSDLFHPGWSDLELKQMGWMLRCDIQKMLRKKQRAQQRVAWRNRDNPAYVRLARISLFQEGPGRNSVQIPVEQPSIRKSELKQSLPGEAIWKRLKGRSLSKVDRRFLEIAIRDYGEDEAWKMFEATTPSPRDGY